MYFLPEPKNQNGSRKDSEKVIKVQLDFAYKRIFLIIAAIAIAAATAAGVYTYRKSAPRNTLGVQVTAQTKEFTDEEIKKIVAKVAQIAILPEDELPTIGAINDPTQLKNQPFFENVRAGDLLLIYKRTGKVYIYDPALHKIVNIGPYAERTSSPQPEAGQPLAETPTPESSPSASPSP